MRADWDQRAKEDAHYYVAFSSRGQSREEFLAGGLKDVQPYEAQLNRLPPGDFDSRRALEVGCGPGRLMLPMSRHFGEIHGVDISPEMVQLARENVKGILNAHVHLTEHSDLRMFKSNTFDFAYSYAVFQHIPSRDIVLNYLREMARVLKPGGILCCQLRGAPPAPSGEHEPETWTGCVILWDDIVQFAERSGLSLVAASGVRTQYMLLTARKPNPATDYPPQLGEPKLNAVTPAAGGPFVPRSGAGAAVSLWLEGLPLDASLLDFEVRFGGRPGFPCYLSPPSGNFGYQLNVLLPTELGLGTVRVESLFRGVQLRGCTIEVVAAAPLAACVLSVTDGIDVASEVVRSAFLKVHLENVTEPQALAFSIDGHAATVDEFVCVNRATSQYEFSVRLPEQISSGEHNLMLITAESQILPHKFHITSHE